MSLRRRLARRRRPAALAPAPERPDVVAARFFAAADALRAEARLAPDGASLVWPSPALEVAYARVLSDWARFNEAHGLPIPAKAPLRA